MVVVILIVPGGIKLGMGQLGQRLAGQHDQGRRIPFGGCSQRAQQAAEGRQMAGCALPDTQAVAAVQIGEGEPEA